MEPKRGSAPRSRKGPSWAWSFITTSYLFPICADHGRLTILFSGSRTDPISCSSFSSTQFTRSASSLQVLPRLRKLCRIFPLFKNYFGGVTRQVSDPESSWSPCNTTLHWYAMRYECLSNSCLQLLSLPLLIKGWENHNKRDGFSEFNSHFTFQQLYTAPVSPCTN